jgi:uncharacterized protein (DUF1501 family)
MNRRDFLKTTFYTFTMMSAPIQMGLKVAETFAANIPLNIGRIVINTMLVGGADLRYLFVPEPGTAYATKFWKARENLYKKYQTYEDVWEDLYLPTENNGFVFGVHRNAAWLRDQFNSGNVAIVSNVQGSENRRHDYSQVIINTGDSNARPGIYDRDGWGGRLAYAIGNANSVAMTNEISIFCSGIDPLDRNAKVIHAKDTRNFGLSPGIWKPKSVSIALARALKGYYEQKQLESREKPEDWPYRKFLNHEKRLRELGDVFKAHLDKVAPQRPSNLRALYAAPSGIRLNNPYFGLQCANVYDSVLGANLLRLRIASLDYSGWDTHRKQKNHFKPKIEDIFGAGKGLDTLTREFELLHVNNQIVYVFTTDFGRQLRTNGHEGTDHGRGNYIILIGRGINGGVYGEMFPESEIQGDSGNTRYDQLGGDIEGKTSFERVLAEVCNWVEPGTGAMVFPNAEMSLLEHGVDLGTLFRT